MDYKELVDRLKSPTWQDLEDPDSSLLTDAATAITDLMARAEAAEDRCDRLEEARENANEACAKWEGMYHMAMERAEKAERERDAAVKELNEVAASIDDLDEFIDEQIHPLVPYDMYNALRDNVDAISVWQYEAEWCGQKEE